MQLSSRFFKIFLYILKFSTQFDSNIDLMSE